MSSDWACQTFVMESDTPLYWLNPKVVQAEPEPPRCTLQEARRQCWDSLPEFVRKNAAADWNQTWAWKRTLCRRFWRWLRDKYGLWHLRRQRRHCVDFGGELPIPEDSAIYRWLARRERAGYPKPRTSPVLVANAQMYHTAQPLVTSEGKQRV